MPNAYRRPTGGRRGVTLVEMLVVVALVVLMMVILVQIFQQATGAMTASRSIQDLDLSLRSLDTRIKQDLIGATARFTPPLDPSQNLGYFEYGENAFADPQGEDSDDYLAFTSKAPEGQVFTGRVFLYNPRAGQNNAGHAANRAVQPTTVTSQLAEIIYFVRNGNLYRRVLLIVPERQNSVAGGSSALGAIAGGYAFPALANFPQTVSWMGVNDISARPTPIGAQGTVLLNTLGDLTNRENRAFRPRFRSDYFGGGGFAPDGYDDDLNGDDIPDFYPTLYPSVFYASNSIGSLINAVSQAAGTSSGTMGSFTMVTTGTTAYEAMPFPYIYPGMYSKPENVAPYLSAYGWIHSLDPSHSTYSVNPFTGNHNPLITGDNLPIPNPNTAGQTWWGFPTWRETLSNNWLDPVNGPNFGSISPTQQNGLRTASAAVAPGALMNNLLPPMTSDYRYGAQTPQYAADGVGSKQFQMFVNGVGANNPNAAQGVWDDDLICTNVRSFDVKALDPNASIYSNPSLVTGTSQGYYPSAGYYDLGYAVQGNVSLSQTPGLSLDVSTPTSLWDNNSQPVGFGHSGRTPGLTTDNRLNPSRPLVGTSYNVVGDNNAGVIRLNRVWDSWSTDYTNAPAIDVFYNGYPGTGNGLPVYPSYPAPYTSPLRGIQIKIRLNDPRGDYPKDLTIRHDFTDKL